MKQKIFTILLFLYFFCLNLQAQTIFFQEDFEAEIIEGWDLENKLSWQFGDAASLSSAYFQIPEHTRIAAVNDDGPGPDISTAGRLITPTIVLTGTTQKLILLDAYFEDGDYNGADERLTIEIRVVGTIEWEELLSLDRQEGEWQDKVRVNIPSIYDDTVVEIAFNYQESDGWNFGAAIDNIFVQELLPYEAVPYITKSSLPTILPITQRFPFEAEYGIENIGANPLTNVVFSVEITKDGVPFDAEEQTIGTVEDGFSADFEFEPTEIGVYAINFGVSESNLGDMGTKTYSYILSDSIFAKDDGIAEQYLGFGFGNPEWYGYYGSEFYLETPDTLTSISLYIAEFSDASGSINFTVNLFDELGQSPDDEIFHSEEISLDKNDLGNVIHYQLPDPLPIPVGRFVVAAGQDTIQGPVGFGFDDNEPTDAFWITSPVAGGGYPWFYTIQGNPKTMLIRPNFGNTPISTSVEEVAIERLGLPVSPNPFTDIIQVKTPVLNGIGIAQIINSKGQVIEQTKIKGEDNYEWNLEHLSSGMYLLIVRDKEQTLHQKIIKE